MRLKIVAVAVVALVLLSGCIGGGGDGGQSGGAEISFTQDETNGIGVQVSDMGSYDAVWVESGNVEGGFQINEARDVPSLYLRSIGPILVYDTCFKESYTAECIEGPPDAERFSEFNGGVEVYGLSDGEKTLVETREP
ncbi:MAG: hypothetical protein U5J64_03235 [Halobacteriales archaeon]|nr:hypothetical protein [Halobacteriales archaeon]